MGTLYIDRKDIEIRMDGKALAFYSGGKRDGLIPTAPLKRVIICGSVMIESAVLHRLASAGIGVLFLSGRRQRFMAALHGRVHLNGFLRVRQYEKSLSPFALEWSREIVSRKLRGQKSILEEALERRPEQRAVLLRGISALERVLESATDCQSMERLRGLEGGAASAYFSAYTSLFPPSLGFTKRRRRPPTDPVNALLSLVYTLIHWEAVREVELIGLDPVIGFYHDFDYGRESLACDLVEPLRPQVDGWVWELFRDRVFVARNFAFDKERPGCYLKKEGRKRFYLLYEERAKGIRKALVEDVRNLAGRITGGSDGENTVPE